MADKEIAALSGAHLRGTKFVYIAALFAALGAFCSATTQVSSRVRSFLSSANLA
jgi:hypothetical protein